MWSYEGGKQVVDPEVAALWPQGDNPSTADEVLDRTRRAFAEEIRIMLDEGVVAAPEDIDLCLILGGGFAFWNGGITPYLDRTGASDAVNGTALPGAGSRKRVLTSPDTRPNEGVSPIGGTPSFRDLAAGR